MNASIIIADDHAVVRQGLCAFLEHSGYKIIAEAESGEQACQVWQEHPADLLLLDLDMPGIGGMEALRRIKARHKTAKVLVFSMFEDTAHAGQALQAGAKGYVVKSDTPQMLLEAVRTILKGGRFIGHGVAQQMAVERLSGDAPLSSLSAREFEVFTRLASGMPLVEIAAQLHIGYKSAANIQTQIKQKLNVKTAAQLIHLALRHGITPKREEYSSSQ